MSPAGPMGGPMGGSGVVGTPLAAANGSVGRPRSRLGMGSPHVMLSPQVKMRDMVAASKPHLSPLPRSPVSIASSPSSARDIAALQGRVIPSTNRYASPRQVKKETNALRDQSRDWVRRYRNQTDKSEELTKGVQAGLEAWQALLNTRQDLAGDCKGSVRACSQLIEKLRHIEQDIVSIDNADLMGELDERKGALDKMIAELGDLTALELRRSKTGATDVVCWVLLVLFVIVHAGLAALLMSGQHGGGQHINLVVTS